MEDKRNYYEVLGVPADAPEAEIRRAFRARAKALHPDSKPGGEPGEGHREFNLLTEAYETLKDPGRREAYDAQLSGSRQLTSYGATKGKPPRAFAMGLTLGLLLAAAAVGAKIYYDRSAVNRGAPKSQESLRIPKAEQPSAIPAESPEPSRQEAESGAAAPSPGPGLPASPAEHSPKLAAGEDQSGRAEGTGPGQPALPPAAHATGAEPSAGQPDAAPSQFAEAVLSLEGAMSSGGGSAAAHQLISLINSASTIDELLEAAGLASKPETVYLIQDRIAALQENQGAQPMAAAQPGEPSLQGSASGGSAPFKEEGSVEVAAGTRAAETILRLHPGNGLRESFSDCATCPEMVAIPGGQAIIGSRPESGVFRPEEAPAHKITIRRPIAVSKRGISAENWRACVDAGVCRPTLASYLSIGPGVPATRVSWFEAKAYVSWLSQSTRHRYRLLSEAEWEYAAQAGSGNYAAETAANRDGMLPGKPPMLAVPRLAGEARQLGATKPNAWGLHPLPGNLLEWVEDCWHASYAQAPADGSSWLSQARGDCAYRVVRGVAAAGGGFGGKRTAARAREFADARSPALGFRVARELPVPARTAIDASVIGRKTVRGD